MAMDLERVRESAGRYRLYHMIRLQPAVVGDLLGRPPAEIDAAAERLARAGRVFLFGTGTSSHAAVVGEHLLRRVGVDAYATTSIDFALYPRPLRPDDAVVAISHRATKRFGRQALARAQEAGAWVLGVTGRESPMEGPDVVLRVAPSEESSTFTQSYTASLAALALVATRVGERLGRDVTGLRAAVERLPETLAAMLDREAAVWPVAEALAASGRLVLAGAGPNAVTAREGALKVKESSYLTAEGFELETLLHGGLQAVERGDVAVLIAARGPALERTLDAARALAIIGVRVAVVADERVAEQFRVLDAPEAPLPPTVIPFPAAPESVSPILAVVPLQLLAALTAALRGTNPDSFRRDDPAYDRAVASYGL